MRLLVALLVLLAGPVADATSGTFLHVTDIHLDPLYVQGGDPRFQCHAPTIPNGAGYYGNQNCSSAPILVKKAMQWMRVLTPDFVIWTGDTPRFYNVTVGDVLYAVRNVTTQLNATFPGVRIFPSLGNHDVWPTNLDLPCNKTTQVLLHDIALLWEPWIGSEAAACFASAGYYSALATPSLRVIALNTNLWSSLNTWISNNVTDPGGHLAWLNETLAAARASGEKVLLHGHVPPGGPEICLPGFLNWYQGSQDTFFALMIEYSDIIVGSLYGHLHSDFFTLVENSAGSAVGMAWSAPSLTPTYNSAVRLFSYDTESSQLLNYEQFWANVSLANEEGQISWGKLYDPISLFGMPDIQPASWQALLQSMKSNATLFSQWYEMVNGVATDRAPCVGSCMAAHLCAIQYMQPSAYSACAKVGCGHERHTGHSHPC